MGNTKYKPMIIGEEHIEVLKLLVEKEVITFGRLWRETDMGLTTCKRIVNDLKAIGFITDWMVKETVTVDTLFGTIGSLQEDYGLDYDYAAKKYKEAHEKWNYCHQVEIEKKVLRCLIVSEDLLRLSDELETINRS